MPSGSFACATPSSVAREVLTERPATYPLSCGSSNRLSQRLSATGASLDAEDLRFEELEEVGRP
jgi:hypothetical protein